MQFSISNAWSGRLARVLLAASVTVVIGLTIARAASGAAGPAVLLQACLAMILFLACPIGVIIAERRRLKRKLSANERRLRVFAGASTSAILHCDVDGAPLFLNPRWTELTGASLADILVNGWEAVLPESSRGRATALWQQVRGRVSDDEDCLPYEFASGTTGWMDIHIAPERDEGGAVLGWVVRLTDVSERIVASRELKDSESLYRLLADNGRDIIIRIAMDGTCLFASAAALLILGKSSGALAGTPLRRSIHSDDWPIVAQCLEQLRAGKLSESALYRQRRDDGRYLWVEAAFHLVRDPVTSAPIEIVASMRDIDLRQKAAMIAAEASQKLRERNRLLTMAEEMAGVGHWQFDAPDAALALSSQAAEMAGLRRSSAITPKAAMALVAPADRWQVKRALVAAVQGKPSGNCRVRVVRDDGSDRIIDFAVQAETRNAGGIVSGVFGVVQDISQKVADEQLLVEALGKANEAANARSSFLATMSHEIRTPMTGVIGMIDLLLTNPSEQERDNFLATLKQSATLLMAVLNDVLDFSKMEHGKLEIKNRDFNFETLAQSTLDLFFNAASQKGLLISLALDPGSSPLVHGDPVRIQQVMSNLVSNAIKFTDTGSIQVRVKARPMENMRQIWRVEIRDTGIGVPEAQAASLFEPFTQADLGDGRQFGGTGLGLAISRQLVDAMGGRMGFDSKREKGSNFWFEITLEQAHAEVVQVRRAVIAVKADRSLRVLVAEDNPVNQLLITAMLRRLGHRPLCVEDGQLAVDAAVGGRFDCILMDMQMPNMNGITATRTIRQSGGPCADVPIIALTADASPERRRFYDNAGLTGFMTKPIDSDDLGARLAGVAASPATASPPDVLDENHLGQLRAALGPRRLRTLLDLFLVELEERPTKIRNHLLAGQIDRAKGEAHSLKGAALSVGAQNLGQAASAFEQLPDALQSRVNERLLGELEKAVVAAIAALHVAVAETAVVAEAAPG